MSPFFVALTLTDVLLLALLVAPRLRWWAKLLAIVITLSFNFLAWSSADSGQGWPVRAGLPDPAEFVACDIVEPDAATGTTGVIYVWMTPLDLHHGVLSYRPAGEEPRAYAEPYDRSLHEACLTAQKAGQQGVRTTIRRRGHGHGPHGQGGGGTYHTYVLPSPALPRKGG